MARYRTASPQQTTHSRIGSTLPITAPRTGSPATGTVPTVPPGAGLLRGAFIFALFFALAQPAVARDPWTTRDSVLQTTALTLMWIDYNQTLQFQDRGIVETNPMLGLNPDRDEITRYFAALAVAHTGLAYVLPKDWRLALQAGQIAVSVTCISGNKQLGVSIRF